MHKGGFTRFGYIKIEILNFKVFLSFEVIKNSGKWNLSSRWIFVVVAPIHAIPLYNFFKYLDLNSKYFIPT